MCENNKEVNASMYTAELKDLRKDISTFSSPFFHSFLESVSTALATFEGFPSKLT